MSNPRTAVISLRSVRTAPYYAHGHHLVDLFAEVFGSTVFTVHAPSNRAQRWALKCGRKLDVAGRFPGSTSISSPDAADLTQFDLIFVMLHDMGDLDLLMHANSDWLGSRATKVLVMVEVWGQDATSYPETFRRMLGHFDAVFCTLEEGIPAMREASGVDVQCMPQAVDVLAAPWSVDPAIDILTIGRRSDVQHELFRKWACSRDGWYHFDTLPVRGVADVDLHRGVTAKLIAKSAISVCNFARFDNPSRIGATRGTGTRYFESVAGGAAIVGALPTDQMFTSEFGDLPGISPLPIDASSVPLEEVDELVRLGRDPGIRRSHRAHALASQDLAHRIRQVLSYIDVREPEALGERFVRLADERHAVLNTKPIDVRSTVATW